MDENTLSHPIIGAAIEVHRALGPGLLESVYEECLAYELMARGIHFERQKALPVQYKSISSVVFGLICLSKTWSWSKLKR